MGWWAAGSLGGWRLGSWEAERFTFLCVGPGQNESLFSASAGRVRWRLGRSSPAAQPLPPSSPVSQPPCRPASQLPSRPAAQAPSRPPAHSLFSASAQGKMNHFFLRRLAASAGGWVQAAQPPSLSLPASQPPKAPSPPAARSITFFCVGRR